mgnify:CR=1 FL=1
MRRRILAAALTAAATITLTPSASAAVVDRETNIYIATPATGCDDANTGATKDAAICTFGRAEKLLNAAYAAGDARGDVYLRLASGPGATRTPQTSGDVSSLNYAPAANTTLHVVPDWYAPGVIPDPRAGRDYVYWAGNDAFDADVSKGNVANHFAFNISPRENRGGTYHIYGQDVTNFVKGIIVNARVDYTGTERDNLRGEGVLLPYSAPVDGLVIEHNRFHQIGSKYANAYDNNGKHIAQNGNAALHFWNTTNTLVENNTFTDVYNTVGAGLGHIIYAYTSSYATVRGNTFDNSNLTAVHRRMSHGWTVTGNDFGPGLERAHNSTWYRNGVYDSDGRLAECRYALGDTDTTNNQEQATRQQSWCTDARRIYAPREVTYTIENGTVRADWTPAATNGQKLAGYTLEVTDNKDTVIDRVEVGPGARSATVPLAKPGLRVGLIARGESGHHTGSSTLRITTDPKQAEYSVTVGTWDRPISERRADTATPEVVSGQEDALSSLGSSSGSFFTMILDLLRKIFDAVAALFTGAGPTK